MYCNAAHLSTFTIVFVFASELFALKPVKHFSDGLRWFGKHGLQWYAGGKLAFCFEFIDANFQQGGYNQVIRG